MSKMSHPQRHVLEKLYGVPTNIDMIWNARIICQNIRNKAREHATAIEKSIWFGLEKAPDGR